MLAIYRKYGDSIMRIFRMDLQLHFFWGFFLTLPGWYWKPLFAGGITVTVVKELLDLWSKNHWSWGDFCCGLTGSGLALLWCTTILQSGV